MTQPQKNTVLACAIVAGLASLPAKWMTIHQARFEGGLGDVFNQAFGGMTIDVTGLNGNVDVLIQTPIWFIVCVAIAASVLQVMGGSKMFAIPRAVMWIAALLAVAWVGVAVGIGLFSGEATLGLGSLLGMTAAVVPLVCLVVPTARETVGDAGGAVPEVGGGSE